MKQKFLTLFFLLFLYNCFIANRSPFDINTPSGFFLGLLVGTPSNSSPALTLTSNSLQNPTSFGTLEKLKFIFSTDLDSRTDIGEKIEFTEENGSRVTFTKTINGKELLLDPLTLRSNTKYLVKIEGLRSKEGRIQESPIDLSFLTANYVNISGGNGLSANLENAINFPSIVSHSGKLFAGWVEKDNSIPAVTFSTIKSFDIDNPTNGWYMYPTIEDSTRTTRLLSTGEHLLVFRSSTNRNFLRTDGSFGSVSIDPTNLPDKEEVTFFNGEVYTSWNANAHPAQVSVRKGLPVEGLFTNLSGNPHNTGSVTNHHLLFFQNKLYIIYTDVQSNANSLIRVAVWNGSWNRVSPETGINFSNLANDLSNIGKSFNPRLIEFSGKLYAFWHEKTPNTSSAIRGKVYNGNDSAPAWTSIDGSPEGINANSAFSQEPYPLVFRDRLILVWRETVSNGSEIRFKVYNGKDDSPLWTSPDNFGIRVNTIFSVFTPQLTVHKDKAYMIWYEELSSANSTYKVYVMQLPF
jgi:hypothetical protein